MHRKHWGWALVLAAAVYAPAWAADLGSAIQDAAITARIETALLLNDSLSAFNIKARTSAGVVTLSGSVSDEIERALAQSIAESAMGVRRVNNEIVVVEETPRKAAKRSWQQTVSDETTAAAIRSRLLYHKELGGLKLTVRVREAVATLFGVVGSDAQKARVEEIALDTRGVDRVVSNLAVNPVVQRDPDRNLLTMMSDKWIEKRVESSILMSQHLSIRDLKVDVQDRVCILTGEVESASQRTLAENIAFNTSGVESVRNEMRIVIPRPSGPDEAPGIVQAPAAPEPVSDEDSRTVSSEGETPEDVVSAPLPPVAVPAIPESTAQTSSTESDAEEVDLEPLGSARPRK